MSDSANPDVPALIPQGHHLGKPPIPLSRALTLIGGRHTAHIHLISRQISKAHALVLNDDARLYVRDLASRTHTFVAGREVREAQLQPGDLLQIGSFKFKVSSKARRSTEPPKRASRGEIRSPDLTVPIPLDERVTLIGRRSNCDIPLLEDSVSTAHAVIFELAGRRFIRDLGSRTGTFVNGRKIRQEELEFDDEIRIGETTMRYAEARQADVAMSSEDEQDLDALVGTAHLAPDALDQAIAEAEHAEHNRKIQSEAENASPRQSEKPPLASAPPVDEIDLQDDLDAPSNDDTVSIPPAPSKSAPKPELSRHVVDEVQIEQDDSSTSALVAGDLTEEKLSSSLTHGTPAESLQEESTESADITDTDTELPAPSTEPADTESPPLAPSIEPAADAEPAEDDHAPLEDLIDIVDTQPPVSTVLPEADSTTSAQSSAPIDLHDEIDIAEPPIAPLPQELSEIDFTAVPDEQDIPVPSATPIAPLQLSDPQPSSDQLPPIEPLELSVPADDDAEPRRPLIADAPPILPSGPTPTFPDQTVSVTPARANRRKSAAKPPRRKQKAALADEEVIEPTDPTPGPTRGLER